MYQQAKGPDGNHTLPQQQQKQGLLFPEIEPPTTELITTEPTTKSPSPSNYGGEDDLGEDFVYCRL